MTTVDALVDIARTFKPMEKEAAVAINSGTNGVYVQAIRENYEPWKFFYADETGDDTLLINSFGYGNLHKPTSDLQGDYVLWNPKFILGANKILPLAKKEIYFDSSCKVWFASFRDGKALAEACLGSGVQKLNLVVPRFVEHFPKLTWSVDRNAVKQLRGV
jgi:hypothetical protein